VSDLSIEFTVQYAEGWTENHHVTETSEMLGSGGELFPVLLDVLQDVNVDNGVELAIQRKILESTTDDHRR
jgi:hypothetical protein